MKFIDLNSQWKEIKIDVYKNLDSFFESSAYVMGPYLEKFENNGLNRCDKQYYDHIREVLSNVKNKTIT